MVPYCSGVRLFRSRPVFAVNLASRQEKAGSKLLGHAQLLGFGLRALLGSEF
jgi:hypothetical protein